MKRLKQLLPVMGLTALLVVPVLAQVLPRDIPERPSPKGIMISEDLTRMEQRGFRLGGKKYIARLSHLRINGSSGWRFSASLPSGFELAQASARMQLATLTTNVSEWRAADIHLSRLLGNVPEKWYYEFKFVPMTWKRGQASDEDLASVSSLGGTY